MFQLVLTGPENSHWGGGQLSIRIEEPLRNIKKMFRNLSGLKVLHFAIYPMPSHCCYIR